MVHFLVTFVHTNWLQKDLELYLHGKCRNWSHLKLKAPFKTKKNILLILGFMVLKVMAIAHGFNAKIGLKNGPTWVEIFSKIFLNMACQTKPQPHFVFSQISRPRVVRFSNRFLH